MKLYTYWRSQATARVRIALNLKGLAVDEAYVHLEKGEQYAEAYRAVNPQPVVPALVLDDRTVLTQSMAILEYLEETHPTPALLPASPVDRARVRAICQVAVSDSHPLAVPRVRHYLERQLGLDEATRTAWIRHWVTAALEAIEALLAGDPRTGRYCHGDAPTFADCCLVPQVNGAQLFGCDLSAHPTIVRVYEACMALDEFARAHPMRQPDAPRKP